MAIPLNGKPGPEKKKEEKAPPEEEGKQAKAPRGTGRLNLALSTVTLLLVGGLYYQQPKPAPVPVSAATVQPGPLADLGDFIVNLGRLQEKRFIRLRVSLALASREEKSQDLQALFKARETHLKDAVIETLSSQAADTLNTPQGKARLKDQLAEALNQRLEEGAYVSQIYFTDFIIQ